MLPTKAHMHYIEKIFQKIKYQSMSLKTTNINFSCGKLIILKQKKKGQNCWLRKLGAKKTNFYSEFSPSYQQTKKIYCLKTKHQRNFTF